MCNHRYVSLNPLKGQDMYSHKECYSEEPPLPHTFQCSWGWLSRWLLLVLDKWGREKHYQLEVLLSTARKIKTTQSGSIHKCMFKKLLRKSSLMFFGCEGEALIEMCLPLLFVGFLEAAGVSLWETVLE